MDTTKLSVKAHRGDAKTLLAFDLPKSAAKNLAGFTIQCLPEGKTPYFLLNSLQFERGAHHAQDATEPPTSSVNAPIHKFRWLHVPGSFHQGLEPFYGAYTYRVTPRYFDGHGALRPIDPSLTASVKVNVAPFIKNGLELGFTRGYVQSQAFVHHFGRDAMIHPGGQALVYDTSAIAGQNAAGEKHTFAQEYEWLGFTARRRVFDILRGVAKDSNLRLDVFAYDLNEPDLITLLLELAKQGRVRIILDNAALHHADPPTNEDRFEGLFKAAAAAGAEILRGKFGRYAHDKVFIVKDKDGKAVKVLTGSTNFSVTGLYVNSNHVLVFDDPKVAHAYGEVFEAAWQAGAHRAPFVKSDLAGKTFSFSGPNTPPTEISFSPHAPEFAATILEGLASRIAKEGKTRGGSVMFAVMALDSGNGPVLPALRALHENEHIFSYGISDSPGGTYLYTPKQRTGLLVTGKPGATLLPAPFDQVPGIGGTHHQVHHKFVVCGFNGPDPVVYCGSSNLAEGGEENNGDNLLAIHDRDVATAFAIEAIALVDHFEFLDHCKRADGKGTEHALPSDRFQAAADAKWFLGTDDRWTAPYYDDGDLRSEDRKLFA